MLLEDDLIFFTDTAVYQGMSGSPVYFDNYLVGIVSMGSKKGELIIERITQDIINYIKGEE
jgi:V8-like Glu-specific endopeptidase